MASDQKCPPPGELKQALLGQSSSAATAAIEEHLDGCSQCLAVLDALQVESHVVDALKAKSDANLDVPADLDRLMSDLDSLHPNSAKNAANEQDDLPVLSPSDNPAELGRLAHFRVVKLLGVGGMGVVYLASDPRLERAVALKVMRPYVAQNPDARARFLREARAVASIKHDHVIVVYEVGEAPQPDGGPSTPYLAMELLDGISLQDCLRDCPRPSVLTAVRLARQTAEALAALHARGLVHRDVKPGNLWIEQKAEGGRIRDFISSTDSSFILPPSTFCLKLLDFGLAASSNGPFAEEAKALGTPAYMAPEQFRGAAVDARSDVFGLGCVLYELCTGELPFPDRRLSADYDAPLPANDVNPAVPAELANLVARMVREDPAERPDSARRIVRELSDIEDALTKTTLPAPLKKTRRRWGIALASVAALTLLVAVIVRNARPPAPTTDGVAIAPPAASPVTPPVTPPPVVPVVPSKDQPPAAVAQPIVKPDPLVETLRAEIRGLPGQKQLKLVVDKLLDLNPGYTREKVAAWIETEGVIRFHENTDKLRDVRPLRALTDLKTVVLIGSEPGLGQLTDLSPLDALSLHKLFVSKNPKLSDLSPIKKMPLTNLAFSDTAVASLADLDKLPLVELRMANTPVKDLGVLRSIPTLRLLVCNGCPIESLDPLAGSALEELWIDYQPKRDAAVLKSLPGLRKVNGMPVDEFWRLVSKEK